MCPVMSQQGSPTSRAPRCKLPIGATLVVTAGVVALGLMPTPAVASEPTACDASALRLSVLDAAPVTPIRASGGATPCASSDGTLLGLPLSTLTVDAVTARTRVVPDSAATSTARVTGARIGATPEIVGLLGSATGPLLTGPQSIVGQIDGLITGPLLTGLIGNGGLLSGLLGSVPAVGSIVLLPTDTSGLLSGLATSLPTALSATLPDVLQAGLIEATAQAACPAAGLPTPAGDSRITGLRVLGTNVNADGAASQLVSLDTAKLDLGQLLSPETLLRSLRVEASGLVLAPAFLLAFGSTTTSVWDLLHAQGGLVGAVNQLVSGLVPGQSLGTILSRVTNGIQPLLDGIEVNLPPGLVRATVTPRIQTSGGGTLTQQALGLSVSALTLPVLSGTLAEARVSTGSVSCTPSVDPPVEPPVDPPVEPPITPPVEPPTIVPPVLQTVPPKAAAPTVTDQRYGSPEAEALLSCLRVPAMLIDVYGQGGRTRIQGATEQRFAGQQATIVLAAGRKRVGRVRIGADGLFSTTVPLPPRAIRTGNRARYYAVVGGQRTSALKFSRRMLVTGLSARGRTVTLTGRVTPPRRAHPEPVVVEQRIGCGKYTAVTRSKPGRDGRFRVRMTAPEGAAATVYRARTRVPATARSTRLRPTFTLPRVIGL